MPAAAGRCSTTSTASTIRTRRCGAWASSAGPTSATSCSSSTARTASSPAVAMRLILGLVLAGGALVLVLVLAAWLADRRIERFAAPYLADDLNTLPEVDVALVLGAAPIGPEGGPNRYFEYRLDAAAELWRAGKVKYLLVSGDNRRPDYDEPSAMRAGMIARGVPAMAIYR